MNVAVVGTGYVGLVVGAGLSDMGHDVVCADVDAAKIERLQRGEIPIYEPGLEPLVARNQEDGRLRFTVDVAAAVRDAQVVFIAVGTPPGEDGSADLQHVLAVAEVIGRSVTRETVVITKSTVPVGTAHMVREAVERHASVPVHVCSNPEFLKEGAAVEDFMKPDRIVVGADSEHARDVLEQLYAPFVRTGNPILFMDVPSAEITKYAANAMLATRISFMNMVAALCDAVGADVERVRAGVGSDPRIGSAFLFPGVGYGGSCFPKDVKALVRTLEEQGVDAGILRAVEDVNERQKRRLLELLDAHFPDGLEGTTVGVWGLAFKPETDDMREAPSLVVVEGLLERGATVRAHDPEAMAVAREHFGGRITFVEQDYEVARGAHALLVLTEWKQYRSPDFRRLRELMARPLLLDGRNLFDRKRLRAQGFEYACIGRPAPPER